MNQNRGQFSRGNGYEFRPRPGYNRGQENTHGRGASNKQWLRIPQPAQVATEVKLAEAKVICKQHHKERGVECF